MAAFCICCGVEITRRAEACPVCGAPQHGMSPNRQDPPTTSKNLSESNKDAGEFRDSKFRER